MKNAFNFLCDKKLLIGIGIGMVLTSVVLMGYEYKGSMSKENIEKAAREMGMHYEDECKVILKGGQ